MSLCLYLLGTPYIEKDGVKVEALASKAIALLSYLAVTGKPHPRERILALLWPESTGESGRKNLRNTLWTLRRTLDEDILLSEGDQLRFNSTLWVDVHSLEHSDVMHTQDSLDDLHNGILLDGFNLNDAPDFEMWLIGERERIGQMYLRAISRQLERYRSENDSFGVITTAQRALAYDLLQEPIHRSLIEVYARIGQRADALRQYDLLSKALMDELGVEPLRETTQLRDQILAGDIDQRSHISAVESPDAIRPRRQPILGGTPSAPFVGRMSEKQELDRAFGRAQNGEGRVVLITGEMGIGKSRLWHEWSTNLPPNMTILEARGLESTQTLPFAPMIELLGSSICLRRVASTPLNMPVMLLAEVARVVPALRTTISNLPTLPSLPFDEERMRLFDAFSQFLTSVDSSPLVFFIDDIHWVDQTMLDWLDYFVHRMMNQGLMLVVAYRPEDATATVARIVAGWGREGVLHRIPLVRLTEPETRLLIQSLGAAPHLAERAHRQSAGNPFFLIELWRAGFGDVSPELSELIRSRLNRLPDTSRQVLQAASVLERSFDFATLRRVSGRGEEETLDALDAIIDASILEEKSGLYSFAHPLVAMVVRNGMSTARKSFLHRRAADAIESVHIKTTSEVAAQLMMHYAAANEPLRAAFFADLAAQRALELAAPAEAIEFYKQALTLSPSAQRQINLARALQRTNDLAASRAAYELAYKAFITEGQLQEAGKTCLELAVVILASGRADLVIQWVHKGMSHLNVATDPASHSLAHFLLAAGRSHGDGSLIEAEMHLKESFDIAQQYDLPDLAARSRFEMGNLQAQRGDLQGALAAYQDALSYAEKTSDVTQIILSHNNYAYHALLLGRVQLAHEHIDLALALAEGATIQMPRQYLYSTRGEIALAENKWDEAESWFVRGVTEATKTGNLVQVANYKANMGLAAQGRSDLDSALIHFETARAAALSLAAPYLQTQIDLWLAELHILRGEPIAAEQSMRRIDERPGASEYARLRAEVHRIRALPKSK